MLRKIIVGLVILIILLQFPGFPYEVTRWVSLSSGLIIVILLAVSKKGKTYRADGAGSEEIPRTLRVERKETEDYPRMHVEKEMDIAVEEKITVTRMRRKKGDADISPTRNV